jgi:hypothetical protein
MPREGTRSQTGNAKPRVFPVVDTAPAVKRTTKPKAPKKAAAPKPAKAAKPTGVTKKKAAPKKEGVAKKVCASPFYPGGIPRSHRLLLAPESNVDTDATLFRSRPQ